MRDAERAEFPSWDYPRLDPRQSYVWIRLDSQWRPARVHKWVYDLAHGRWVCWTFVNFGQPASLPEWYVFDPETIRQRHDDTPPER